jgi:hypothetical protein
MTARATVQVGQFGRPTLSKDGRTITVRIPISLRHQGGRKQVVTPAGATPWVPARTRVDSTLVKAIVRAHRWRDMLESGDYATVRDLAKAEAINESYLGRVPASPRSRRPLSTLSSKADSRPTSNSAISSSNSQSNGTSNSEA